MTKTTEFSASSYSDHSFKWKFTVCCITWKKYRTIFHSLFTEQIIGGKKKIKRLHFLQIPNLGVESLGNFLLRGDRFHFRIDLTMIRVSKMRAQFWKFKWLATLGSIAYLWEQNYSHASVYAGSGPNIEPVLDVIKSFLTASCVTFNLFHMAS